MGIPVAITMGGGNVRQLRDTVDIHFQTATAAVEFKRRKAALDIL
jgi:hypothetical protein